MEEIRLDLVEAEEKLLWTMSVNNLLITLLRGHMTTEKITSLIEDPQLVKIFYNELVAKMEDGTLVFPNPPTKVMEDIKADRNLLGKQ